MPHFFYLARCADKSLYAGTCVDLDARLEKHNAGTLPFVSAAEQSEPVLCQATPQRKVFLRNRT